MGITELNFSVVKQLSDYKYDKVGDLIWSGFYKVYTENKCGAFYVGQRNGGAYIMSAGKVVPPYFDDISQLGTKDYFKVLQNGLWGVYSTKTNSLVIEPKYDNSAIQYRSFDTFRINGQDVKVNTEKQSETPVNTYSANSYSANTYITDDYSSNMYVTPNFLK